MSSAGVVIGNLSRMRMNGFGICLRDFGTGGATIEQLRRIPFTELKIASVLVKRILTGFEDRAAVEAGLEMAHRLRIDSVAAGVQNGDQLSLLRTLGCRMVQGDAIAVPMRAAEFARWVTDTRASSFPLAARSARRN
jgi:EAL domain-containing protein (putative c-di-GMP-specific phosphodiesterase class I)